jgi:hypothetical protein
MENPAGFRSLNASEMPRAARPKPLAVSRNPMMEKVG